ncbi:MAG: Crp/Fnr family transcriptional regulator [Candidatus Xenobiia bacterium LiM19]
MEENQRFLELINEWRFAELLGEETKKDLLCHAKLIKYESGETIIKKDHSGKTFWIVSKGRVTARTKNEAGEEIILQEMKPGDFFGEIALLYQMPRTVDIVAEEEVELYMLSQKNFEQFLSSNKKIEDEIRDFAEKRLELSREVMLGKKQNGLFERLRELFKKKPELV